MIRREVLLAFAAGFATMGCATLLTSSQFALAVDVDETALVTSSGAAKVGLQPGGSILPKLAQQQDPSTSSRTSPQISAAEQAITIKLENAGYTEIRDIKSTAEGIVAKAKKDGKEVTLISDSSGNFRER